MRKTTCIRIFHPGPLHGQDIVNGQLLNVQEMFLDNEMWDISGGNRNGWVWRKPGRVCTSGSKDIIFSLPRLSLWDELSTETSVSMTRGRTALKNIHQHDQDSRGQEGIVRARQGLAREWWPWRG